MALLADLTETRRPAAHVQFSSAPYPGLRPFEREEHDIFFGRERQTDQLLARLQRSKFLAIVGPSGCGKSSLVRAGMMASLEAGFMTNAGSRWRTIVTRPGEDPFGDLARAIVAPDLREPVEPDSRLFVEAALRRGPLGLVEVIREARLCDGASVLVIVDQFEELFRLRAGRGVDEADSFVAMLLATPLQKRMPVYVALTMRSDYLGDCAVFHGLPEAINDSQYLTPKMTREECALAITGPARVFGGEVDAALVNRLLNDFGPDADQLPVLQHALMRMWSGRRPAARAQSRVVLTVEDYDKIGGLGRALSRHADEAFGELSRERQRIAEILFKRLSARPPGRADTRAPVALDQIRRITGAELADVVFVAESFRRADRRFLTSPAGDPLAADQLLDICHESLIRNWERMSNWVREEAEASAEYARLKDTARLWEAGKAPLWDTSNLDRALAWRAQTEPSPDWAARYGSAADYALAMRFLSESESARQAEEAREQDARRRQLRRARQLAVLFAAGVMGLLLAGFSYYHLVIREHFADYATVVRIRGVPRGLRAVAEADRQHRPVSMRIVRRGLWGPVLRLEARNSRDQLIAPAFGNAFDVDGSVDTEAVRWEFVYDGAGALISEIGFDAEHREVGRLVYAAAGRADSVVAYDAGPDGLPSPNKPFIHIAYSPEGYEVHLRYQDRAGRPAPNSDRALGQRRAYDASGRLIALTSLGADDQPRSDAFGNATLKMSYDAAGNEIEDVALDAAGQVVTVTDGWAKRQRAYDHFGNVVEKSFFDAEGRPASQKEGHHKVKYELDERGNRVRSTNWNATGEAVVDVDGCYGHRFLNDARDDVVENTCTGKDGGPARNRDGYATLRRTYDGRHNVVDSRYLAPDGSECASVDGYSRIKRVYDGARETERAYFGVAGQPVPTKEGFASKKSQYDGRGNLVGVETYGVEGKPIDTEKDFARVKSTYDAFDNLVETRYFGADDKPAIDSSGYAGWRSQFDARGNEIERIYVGRHDERVISIDGYAGWHAEFDDLGKETRKSYVGLRDEPVFSVAGVAGWTSEYDARGDETRRRYFGVNGKSATHAIDDAGWDAVYDARGNQLAIRFVDVAGAPALHKWKEARPGEGYTSTKREFDLRGNLTGESYFGAHDEAVLGEKRFAKVVHGYDERGSAIDTRYFGIHGEPIAPNRYHRIRRRYDERGNQTEIAYLGIDGNLVLSDEGYARLVTEHDPHGRRIAESAFGADEQAAHLPSGCERETYKLDPWGNVQSEDCRTSSGEPMLRSDGFFAQQTTYDSRGNVIGASLLGLHGEKVLGADRFARVQFDLDDRGNAVGVSLFGVDDKPVSGKQGISQIKRVYGQGNRLQEEAYFGVDGKPMMSNGYWLVANEYDERRRKTWVRYFDVKRKPVFVPSERCASYHLDYDEQGNEIERAYFGSDGKPVFGPDGVHRTVTKYNERRQPVEVATYDVGGRLMVGRERYARILRKYDDDGRLSEVATFGIYDNPIPNRSNVARTAYRYDVKGNVTEEAYFGMDGKPVLSGRVATIKRQYDDRANAVEESYFDVGGKRTWPVARMERQFDEQNRLAAELYFGPDDKPVRLLGYLQHVTHYEYDDRGNRVGATYRGLTDEPSNGMSDDWKTCARWYARFDAKGKRIESGCAKP